MFLRALAWRKWIVRLRLTALTLWRLLELDEFWAERRLASRKGARRDLVLLVLTDYRLIAPLQLTLPAQRACGLLQ